MSTAHTYGPTASRSMNCAVTVEPMTKRVEKVKLRRSAVPRRWVSTQLADLRARLEAVATPERAEHERAYLHSELEHLGVDQPGIRALARAYANEQRDLDTDHMRTLLDAAWLTEVHELRSVAIALAERWRRSLTAADLELFERWLQSSATWAHVDWLAVKVVGWIVANASDETSEEIGTRLDRWSVDENFWLRRASMLALLDPLRSRDGGDFPRFERYAVAMLDETEFFIRKAIGWILRDLGRKHPERTRAFVEAHLDRMSGLSLREAIKCLPTAKAEKLKARHAALGKSRGRKVRPLTRVS
jgi:3-methyladenine DNA glycosylase AlkD